MSLKALLTVPQHDAAVAARACRAHGHRDLFAVFSLAAATFNVRDYGAAGNGVANDQPAIQAAINAAIAAGPGNTVSLPAGTYLLATNNSSGNILDINNSTKLTFTGATGTELISSQQTTQLLSMWNNTNLTVENFTVDYKPYAYSQGTITAYSFDSKTVTFTTDPDLISRTAATCFLRVTSLCTFGRIRTA